MSSSSSVKEASLQELPEKTAKHEIEHKEDATDEHGLPILAPLDTDEPEISLKHIVRTHPISKWTKTRFHIYLICFCLFLSSTMNGFDGSLMTSINTLDEYQDYYDLSGSADGTGLVFSIYSAGAICSVGFLWLSDSIGRVKTMIVGLIGIVIFTILMSVSANHNLFIAGRFFVSFFSTITLLAAPVYMVEMIPPDLGFLIGVLNTCYYLGSIIATWCMYGTSIHYKGTPNSFKIALWLQLLCPGIVLLFVWTFPESPRWLYAKGNKEKAREIIVKYHANGDANHPVVQAEFQQIERSFAVNGFLKPKDYLDFRVFINTKANRKKSFIVLCWSWFNQFSGNQVITYYITTLFLQMGIENATTRLLLTGINNILCLIFAVCGGLLRDKIPRRVILIYAHIGFIICFVGLAVSSKFFQQDSDNKQAAAAGIAFIYIFSTVFFAFAFTSIQPIYPSEVMSNDMRVRGMVLYFLISNVASFVNLYSAPVAMENIKYWYYVFFVFWDLFQLLIVYFFFVETSALTLEEIEKMFETTNPVKESIRLSKIARSKKFEDALQ
ncbi:putative lactose permease [Hyphopichia burtonii NRRL Y-1933]|uniref:Putative lactose permease n=1 Tax=Hyphopichia burtonii NRRL Y-1933 TaxID=984485 RepID=A0A1E4RDH8_9ASCO|nr:putative lactose permease [Hyphopichia burtonii NRRL Y-1933]ODV65317.1 putative lactose permease [Hyphopichia burtonii NRRL Y-1933]